MPNKHQHAIDLSRNLPTDPADLRNSLRELREVLCLPVFVRKRRKWFRRQENKQRKYLASDTH